MSEENKADSTSRRTPGHLEREESQLWRWALMFLVLLATGLAAFAWDRQQDFPYHLGAVPIGLVVSERSLPSTCTVGGVRSLSLNPFCMI